MTLYIITSTWSSAGTLLYRPLERCVCVYVSNLDEAHVSSVPLLRAMTLL